MKENDIALQSVDQALTAALQDLDIEELLPVELNVDATGHPENLASSKWCCCCVSVLPT